MKPRRSPAALPIDKERGVNRRKFVQAAWSRCVGWWTVVARAERCRGKEYARCGDPGFVPWRQFEVEAALYAWTCTTKVWSRSWTMCSRWRRSIRCTSLGRCIRSAGRRPRRRYPHNPVRPFWMAEDARANWFFDPKRYGRIKPRAVGLRVAGRHRLDARLCGCGAQARAARGVLSFSHSLVDKQRVERRVLPIWRIAISRRDYPCAQLASPGLPQPAGCPRVCRQRVLRGGGRVQGGRVESAIVFDGRGGGRQPGGGGGCFAQHARRPRLRSASIWRRFRRRC